MIKKIFLKLSWMILIINFLAYGGIKDNSMLKKISEEKKIESSEIVNLYDSLFNFLNMKKEKKDWEKFAFDHSKFNKEFSYYLDSNILDNLEDEKMLEYLEKIKKYYGNNDFISLYNKYLIKKNYKVNKTEYFNYIDLLLTQNKIFISKTFEKNIITKYINFAITEEEMYKVAKVYYLWGENRKCIDILKKIDKNNNSEYKILLGKCYYNLEEYEISLEIFSKVLEKGDNYAGESALYIARIYNKMGDWKKSAEKYLEFTERFPNHNKAAESLWAAAWIYERRDSLNNARNIYESLILNFPKFKYCDEAEWRIGFIEYQRKNYKTAEKYFRSVSEKYKNTPIGSQGLYWLWKIDKSLLSASQRNLLENTSKTFDYYMLKYNNNLKNEFIFKNKLDEFIQNQYSKLSASERGIYKIAIKYFENDYKLLATSLLEKYGPNKYLNAYLYKEYGMFHNVLKELGDDIYNNAMLPFSYTVAYKNEVLKYSKLYNVDPALVMAIMRTESVFNPKALSPAGARGLLQLMPKTAEQVANRIGLKLDGDINDLLFIPEINIQLGVYHIKELLDLFQGNFELAIASYNAGTERAKIWKKDNEDKDVMIENIYYDETRYYVKKVMRSYWIYKMQLNS